MSSFTKGKWEACVDGSVDLKDDSGRVIDVYSGILRQYPNEGELMANARLIAAAPKMYRILKDIQAWCEHDDLDSDIECDIWEVLNSIDGKEAEI